MHRPKNPKIFWNFVRVLPDSSKNGISENGEPDSGFALLGVVLKQMIAIEIILHIVYSKNTGIYSGFCMCHNLKDEDEDTCVIHPSPR